MQIAAYSAAWCSPMRSWRVDFEFANPLGRIFSDFIPLLRALQLSVVKCFSSNFWAYQRLFIRVRIKICIGRIFLTLAGTDRWVNFRDFADRCEPDVVADMRRIRVPLFNRFAGPSMVML
jgi:hypothetical protein